MNATELERLRMHATQAYCMAVDVLDRAADLERLGNTHAAEIMLQIALSWECEGEIFDQMLSLHRMHNRRGAAMS